MSYIKFNIIEISDNINYDISDNTDNTDISWVRFMVYIILTCAMGSSSVQSGIVKQIDICIGTNAQSF